MRGLSTLIRLSACTTSGQFWQVIARIGFEDIVAVEVADLRDRLVRQLGRMAADLKQRQHQRGELVAERDAGEAHADIRAGAADQEAGAARIVIGAGDGDLRMQFGDLVQQLQHLRGLGPVVERGDQFHRLAEVTEIGLELGLEMASSTDGLVG